MELAGITFDNRATRRAGVRRSWLVLTALWILLVGPATLADNAVSTIERVKGSALPALKLGALEGVREGQSVLFTGFPIGGVLGMFAATHRGMIAAITPIAIPPPVAGQLNSRVVRRLAIGAFPVLQLDAPAYPGNSGSPVYDPDSGDVLGIVNSVFVQGTKETAL